MAAALVALLRALAAVLSAAVEAGLVAELAARWRAQRIEASERALQLAEQRRAQALAAGDARALDADLADLERELDKLLQPAADDANGHRRR